MRRLLRPCIILSISAILVLLVSGRALRQPHYFAAIVRSDGRIQTNASRDGVSWPGKSRFIHMETSPFGPGIASTPEGLVILVFFQELKGTNHNLLTVKRSMGGKTWETVVGFKLPSGHADVRSAPVISHIQDNVFALAWREGTRIRTVTYDADVQQGSAFTDTGLVGRLISGTPSITFDGNRASMVWREGHDIGRVVGKLKLDKGKVKPRRVLWEEKSAPVFVFPPDQLIKGTHFAGSPSVFFDGSRYFLTAITNNGTLQSGISSIIVSLVVFDSEDGAEFHFIRRCMLPIPVAEPALAANWGVGFILLAPGVEVPNGQLIGPLPQSCQIRKTWLSAFGDEGSTGTQRPAITVNIDH